MTSCSSDDSPSENTNNEFVGKWRAISKEGSNINDYDFLEFNKDATCAFQSYPYFKNGNNGNWAYGKESKLLTIYKENSSLILTFSVELLSNGDILLRSTDNSNYSAVYRKYVESELPANIRIIGPWYLVSKKGDGCFGNENDYTYVTFDEWGFPTFWYDQNMGAGWKGNSIGIYSWQDGHAIRKLYFNFNKDGSWTATVEGSNDESTYSREKNN